MSESELLSAGIAPSMVENLQTQTDRRTLAIDLPAIVRTGTLILTVGLACFLTGSLLTGSAVNTEWRTAVERSLLGNVPYTTAAATSGDMIVVQGQNMSLVLELKGRVERDARLLTRPLTGERQGVSASSTTLENFPVNSRREKHENRKRRADAQPLAGDFGIG